MSNPELVRIARVKAYQDTLNSSPKHIASILLLSYNPSPIYESKPYENTDHKFEVVNMDTLNAAESLISKGLDPLVLCFADDKLPEDS
jgi:hypothetical protein